MKSSTLNPSLHASVSDDKRVKALMNQQVAEHKAIIASHHKEMQELRDSLFQAMERFTSLFEQVETLVNKKSADFDLAIGKLQEKTKRHEALIADQKQTGLSLHADMNKFHETHAQKVDVDKVKRDLSSIIQQANIADFNAFQCWQHSVNSVIKSFKGELEDLKTALKERMDQQDKKVESNFSIALVDKEGVSKEIRAYHKSIFIIEKKIENIYTLIERGKACHKPA